MLRCFKTQSEAAWRFHEPTEPGSRAFLQSRPVRQTSLTQIKVCIRLSCWSLAEHLPKSCFIDSASAEHRWQGSQADSGADWAAGPWKDWKWLKLDEVRLKFLKMVQVSEDLWSVEDLRRSWATILTFSRFRDFNVLLLFNANLFVCIPLRIE